MTKVHTDSPVHRDDNKTFVNDDAFKNYKHNQIQHVGIAVLDTLASQHEQGMSEVEQHAVRASEDSQSVCSHAIHEDISNCNDGLPASTSFFWSIRSF